MQNSTNSRSDPQGQNISVAVDLRRRENPTSAVKAHADVEIKIGNFGSIHVLGFSVFHQDGKSPIVLPPAAKGERRSFPHVKLTGQLRARVESAVLREYEEVVEAASV